MKAMIKLSLYFGCAPLVFAASTASAQTGDGAVATAQAEKQAKPPMDDYSGADIVVTAQRREERVQDIPVAITAFGADQLARTAVVSIENVAPRVPNFYFGSLGAARPQLYIRGIATRYDQLAESFLSMVHIAAARYWVKFVHAA